MTIEPLFDGHAGCYDEEMAAALSPTGEDKEYFARARISWLRRRLDAAGARAQRVLDFGCGTGSATPYLFDVLGVSSVHGVDVSPQSLELASKRWGSPRASFSLLTSDRSAVPCDIAFCNGVFHHIPVADRAKAVTSVSDALEPGGWFALWENSPWNPGTRYVMSRCAFDRDAVLLSPPETRRLLRAHGFDIVRTDFLFIFPNQLRALRWTEPLVSRLPLGGQYQVLCRKRVGRGQRR